MSKSVEPLRISVRVSAESGTIFEAQCREIGLTVGGLTLDELRAKLQAAVAIALNERENASSPRPILIAFE